MAVKYAEKEGYFLKLIRLEFNIPVKSEQEEEQLLTLYCDGSLHQLTSDTLNNQNAKQSVNSDISAKFDSILNLLQTFHTSEQKSTSIPATTKSSTLEPTPIKQEQTLPKRKPSNRKGLLGGKTLKRN